MAAVLEKSISTNITETLLQCPICQSQFLRPKVLSCQHSFCAKCLKGWLETRSKNTNKVKCAVCRETTVLPAHGVDALPENYALKGLISMMKERGGKAKEAKPGPAKKTDATKKPPSKEAAKAVPSKTNPKSGKRIGAIVAAKVAAKHNHGAKEKAGATTSKKDKNANVERHGDKKKPLGKVTTKKKTGPTPDSESTDSDDSSGLTDESDSEMSSDSCSSDDDDSELTVGSSEEESGDTSSGRDSDVPSTPTLKNYGEIKVGMEVYVFNQRGKRFPGRVKLLETCQLRPPSQTRTYAGIELTRENTRLITADLDDIEDSYLSYWLGENENPCAIVRADDCMPASLVEQLLQDS